MDVSASLTDLLNEALAESAELEIVAQLPKPTIKAKERNNLLICFMVSPKFYFYLNRFPIKVKLFLIQISKTRDSKASKLIEILFSTSFHCIVSSLTPVQ